MHWQYVLQLSRLQQSRRNTSLPRLSSAHQCTAGLVTARQAGAGRCGATAGNFAVLDNGDATAAGHSAKACHGTSLFRSHLIFQSSDWSLPGLSHFPRKNRQVTGEAHVAKKLAQIPSPVPIVEAIKRIRPYLCYYAIFPCFFLFFCFLSFGMVIGLFLWTLGSLGVARHVNASIWTTCPNAMVK